MEKVKKLEEEVQAASAIVEKRRQDMIKFVEGDETLSEYILDCVLMRSTNGGREEFDEWKQSQEQPLKQGNEPKQHKRGMQETTKDKNVIILAKRIYDFITHEGGGITFAAISYKFGIGTIAVANGNKGLWCFFTDDVHDAIAYLIERREIIFMPSTREAYARDGFEITIPIYTHDQKKPLKELHWNPVCLWTARQAKQGLLELPKGYKKFYRELRCDV